MNIILVPATQEDYLWFVEVFKEVEEFHRLQAPWKFKQPEPELFTKEYYMSIITSADSKLLLAKDGERVVWCALAFIKKASDIPVLKPRIWVDIDTIVVQETYKKKWIGKILLQKVEDRAKENAISDIELNVRDFNQWAIKFYEKSWFTTYSHKMRKIIQ